MNMAGDDSFQEDLSEGISADDEEGLMKDDTERCWFMWLLSSIKSYVKNKIYKLANAKNI